MQKKKITVLGSTGSIGLQTLEVCDSLGFEITALAADKNVHIIEKQARKYRPRIVAMNDTGAAKELRSLLKDTDITVAEGIEGICEAAAYGCDIVVNAIVGIAGLMPTLSAIDTGNDIALANKETLVAAGEIVMKRAAEKNIRIIPVDSEHSAVFQCLQAIDRKDLDSIILTASGGPFFGKTKSDLAKVTIEEALHHPNWSMGSKITIDSASMLNKGLEIIEAMWLFSLPPEKIEVVIHRESVVHSAIRLVDGAVIAQLGIPDMKLPIQYALTYPERVKSSAGRLSLKDYGRLTFFEPDSETFTAFRAMRIAAEMGGLSPCAANASGEEATNAFISGKIPFTYIGDTVMQTVERFSNMSEKVSIESILMTDEEARRFARKQMHL